MIKILENLNTGIIILIVSVCVVALVGIFLLLDKFVFKKNKMKKNIRDLDRRFEYLHALLIGQDAQYVKRLEIISRTNLLYVELHTKFLKRFKEVRDRHDSHAQASINRLRDLLEEKKFKLLKTAISEAQETISFYEKEVNTLNTDLLAVVKPEEDCRQSSLSLKDSLRRIKQEYYSKQSNLQLVVPSFEAIFKMLDQKFRDFEDCVESAQYDDANNILPQIEKVLQELSEALSELPNLCTMVTDIIPDKISSLERSYEIMVDGDYPLHHLMVSTNIQDMKNALEYLTKRIKKFELHDVAIKLDEISSRIDEFGVLFEEEKEARRIFEEENEGIYTEVNTIERQFIKLCNLIPDVNKIYTINPSYQSKITEIQNEINKVGAFKRSLDTYVHSTMKQPYSLLVNKMRELQNATNIVISELDEFKKYLDSLKTDSEDAFGLIHRFYAALKNAEANVREIGIDKISEKYNPQLDEMYSHLEVIQSLLFTKPIDVDKVNEEMKILHELGDKVIFEGGEIEQDKNMMMLAENALLYANRDRAHFNNVNQIVKQGEINFFNGEFEKTYVDIAHLLEDISQNQGQ